MTKRRLITLAIVFVFALGIGGLSALAVGPSLSGTIDSTKRTATGTDANLLANPGVYGTTALSGTGMATNYPGPTPTPIVGTNNGVTSRPGVGAGLGANIGGLGVGIGANVGGVGNYNAVTDSTRGYNQMSPDRSTTRGMTTNGISTNYDTSKVRNYGTTTNRNMSWGWLGLLGLIGLAGIRTGNRMPSRQESNR